MLLHALFDPLYLGDIVFQGCVQDFIGKSGLHFPGVNGRGM